MTIRSALILICTLAAMLVPGVSASAQSRAELKQRFEDRYPNLVKLLDAGKAGETWEGFVEPVKADAKLSAEDKRLIDEENDDRRALYQILSKKHEKTTPTEVGRRNAIRKFDEGKPGFHFKTRDGHWVQRKDATALKREGKIGETFDGRLGIVKGQRLNEQQQALVTLENAARQANYERKAVDRKTSTDEEARRAGRENIEKAKAGEFVQDESGEWKAK
jgi:uncharacterized protein YdbL (DUF1318 family)